MLRFRKKLLISGAAIFALFIALLFLFIHRSLDPFLSQTGMQSDEICFVIDKFKIAILAIGGSFLFLYSTLIWAVFSNLSRPLQKITDHILSYTEGDLFPSILMEDGEFGKVASILNSMTAKIKKQMDHLKIGRQETSEILESLGEGVVSVDTQGKTTFTNESACKILGIGRDAMIANPLNQIDAAQKDLASKCYELIQDVLQTSELIRETWNDGKRGRTHLELTAAPRPGHRGAILVLQDKTSDFKVLEMGKDFIANASHELRTPITIIRGFAETLQDHPGLSPQMIRDISEKIVRTSHRLENLVRSLLTLADIENFPLEKLQSTDLVSIAEHSKQLIMTASPDARIAFATDLERAPIVGEPHLLDLAVMNLLENGIKYSSSPAELALSIRKMGNEVHLIIQDKGIGIPEADLPHIFERFYTVDKARSRKSGGAGLGLSIVKTIVEKHHGTVSAVSQLGFGSTITIRLPLKE